MSTQPHLPAWQYQPAHNLYLLIYTEMGLLGILALGGFLILLLRSLILGKKIQPLIRWGLVSLAALVLFAALFDHFFWTLQQGRLLWWLFWGVVAVYATNSE